MKQTGKAQNIQVGLWSAFVSSAYLVMADYLLKYFSPSWLLLTSLMIMPLLIPTAWNNRSKYIAWSRSAWLSFLLVGILSGAYNLAFLLTADRLPISVASMFLSIASVMVLPLTCLMQWRLPGGLELASITMVWIGVALVLQLHAAVYSIVGISLGLLTTFLSANATIYSGKIRNILAAKEAMISKQLGKLSFATLGMLILVKEDVPLNTIEIYLWFLLGLYGAMKIYDSFVASRAQFVLPPLVFQSLNLLSLPLVCIIEILLFKGSFSSWQWIGVLAIILAGFFAARSKQIQLKAFQ